MEISRRVEIPTLAPADCPDLLTKSSRIRTKFAERQKPRKAPGCEIFSMLKKLLKKKILRSRVREPNKNQKKKRDETRNYQINYFHVSVEENKQEKYQTRKRILFR